MAKRCWIGVVVFLLGLPGPAEAVAATTLRAGAARAIITPDVARKTVYLAGFGHNRVATGVHDDLDARCLALEAGGTMLALCSVDLIEPERSARGNLPRLTDRQGSFSMTLGRAFADSPERPEDPDPAGACADHREIKLRSAAGDSRARVIRED
jgi:hypothetical protein